MSRKWEPVFRKGHAPTIWPERIPIGTRSGALRRRLDVADCRAKLALQLRNRHAQKTWEVHHGPDRRDRTFFADMSAARVPPAAVSIVKTGFTDCVAVMIAGWREPVVGVVAALTGAPLPEHPFAPACLRMAAADRAMLYAHRRARARFRRHRALRPSQRRAGARDPGARHKKAVPTARP